MSAGDGEVRENGQPWWVGHPVVKYPAFVLIAAGLASRFVLEGDAEVVVLAACLLVLSICGLVSGVHLMRGTLQPLPYAWAQRLNPIGAGVVSVGFTIGSLAMLVDVLVAPTERWGPVMVGAWTTIVLVLAGLVIEVLSRTDTWPEGWKAPYQRGSAGGVDDAGGGSGVGERAGSSEGGSGS